MKKQIKLLSLLLLMFISFNIFADEQKYNASFACDKANSPLEKLICGDQYLRHLDFTMAQLFTVMKNQAYGADQLVIIDKQRQWLKDRYSQCGIDKNSQLTDSAADKAKYCLMNLYEAKNLQLLRDIAPNDKTQWKVNITSGIDFDNKTVTGKLSHNEIEQLTYAKISGGGQFPEGLGENKVKNCQEYWMKSVPNNTTYDMSMAGFFDHTCGVLERLLHAEKPAESYLNNIQIYDAQYLSPTLLPVVNQEGSDQLDSYSKQGLSIADLIKQGKVKITHANYSAKIYYDGQNMESDITEIARADFNGDGKEEILVTVGEYATQGSYRDYQVCLLGRLNEHELLRYLTCT